MSDYLQRLIARHFGGAPSVRPSPGHPPMQDLAAPAPAMAASDTPPGGFPAAAPTPLPAAAPADRAEPVAGEAAGPLPDEPPRTPGARIEPLAAPAAQLGSLPDLPPTPPGTSPGTPTPVLPARPAAMDAAITPLSAPAAAPAPASKPPGGADVPLPARHGTGPAEPTTPQWPPAADEGALRAVAPAGATSRHPSAAEPDASATLRSTIRQPEPAAIAPEASATAAPQTLPLRPRSAPFVTGLSAPGVTAPPAAHELPSVGARHWHAEWLPAPAATVATAASVAPARRAPDAPPVSDTKARPLLGTAAAERPSASSASLWTLATGDPGEPDGVATTPPGRPLLPPTHPDVPAAQRPQPPRVAPRATPLPDLQQQDWEPGSDRPAPGDVERAPATPLPLPDTARRQSTTAAAIAPLLRPSRTAQAAPAAPPAQPEVNITIGRVELRAAPPPPAPAAPMRTAPRVSLDDYLQSRGGPRP